MKYNEEVKRMKNIRVFHFLQFLSILHFRLPIFLFVCKYLAFYFFIPLFQKLYIQCKQNFLSMTLILKMTVEWSKCHSYFLSLVFITKCFSKNFFYVYQ